MILRIKVLIPIVFVVCAVSTIICNSSVLASNAVAEVSVSPDLRRVAIKLDGRIGGHTSAVMAHPSRLVIDIPAAGVGPEPRIIGVDKNSAMHVRIAKTNAGAQVALDFGAVPVPDHRVCQMDNYLIVLLGEWQPQPRIQGNAEHEKAPAQRPISATPQNAQAVAHAAGSELLIKSVEEVNGTIVLKVSKRTEPQRVYRIDLGVDFQQLGFNGANVYPVGGGRDGSERLAEKMSSWAKPSAQGKKIGPRKMRVPVAAGTRVAATVRKPASNSHVPAVLQARGKAQGNLNRVELGRVRPYTPPTGGITRKNLE
ncbi:MAG: hypothetical protein ACLP5H_20275 [Desulfomonilaceae bacterium]